MRVNMDRGGASQVDLRRIFFFFSDQQVPIMVGWNAFPYEKKQREVSVSSSKGGYGLSSRKTMTKGDLYKRYYDVCLF